MTCKKAQRYFESNAVQVTNRADASKDRRSRAEALRLAKTADRIVVSRGKKVVTFDMKNDPPDDDTLAANLLGPSGNLRAPTVRKGKTLLVGFNDEEYTKALGV
jgi:arsenate reductase-like glutaredoxin family protein